MKSFIDFTKSISGSARDSIMTTTNLMQSRINTLQLKKGHLKTLLQQSHKTIETANDKTSRLPGEIDIRHSNKRKPAS